MSVLLTGADRHKCRVSSTLNKSAEFSSKNMFKEGDCCWNSDQGPNQFVSLDFLRDVEISKICITFQGGFVGQDCEVKCGNSLKEMEDVDIIYPEDTNDCQEFPIRCCGRCISIIFPSSTDFYGRITIYSLEVYGNDI